MQEQKTRGPALRSLRVLSLIFSAPALEDYRNVNRLVSIAAVSGLTGMLLLTVGSILSAQMGDDAQGLIQRGAKAFLNRDFILAGECFSHAAQLRPGDARVWKSLGMAYAAQNRPELAEPAFRRACTLNSSEENACYYHGRSLFMTARFREALEAFQTALASAG